MAIFRSRVNEKDQINNGLATGASVTPTPPPPPPSHRIASRARARFRCPFPLLAPATQATHSSTIVSFDFLLN